ncbi:kinesin-like protein KIN-13A isoform X2 [Spinacia oleracea]|nr:kinesin-like protein KIN-13A isoform X2 [Spinacia oleracea]
MRNLNFNGESGSEPYTPTGQSVSAEGFYSPEFRGDFGAGLLDLHAMDDTELLSEHVFSEPFEPSPFMPSSTASFDGDNNLISNKQLRGQGQADADAPSVSTAFDKGTVPKENNVAKLRVVVRKRPLNKKELSRKEDDVVTVYDNALTVHEPKLKVDLTAYVEKHEFCFDAVLDEHVTNDEVYRGTVEPIIPTIFQRTKATCFAYGQTGSGKTFTMKPLPIRAAEDLLRLLHQPVYRNQRFKLWLSYFEIYGGKLFDLLCDRKKLCMREDGRQQVCIVGLQEFEVCDVQIVKEYIERGNGTRSTGSTGANEESSRSHAILQLVVKKHSEIKDTRRNNDVNEAKIGKVVGKISFIDLAGSERGADTTDNDRQTRIEGAEINKSLLALKECIRALDNDQNHIPFRGSKLTEVLRDSFVGNSKTVMISCISPNAGSCEHTLNTLRYADRVKSLSKSGNVKKDTLQSSVATVNKESSSVPSTHVFADVEVVQEHPEARLADVSRKAVEKENFSYNPSSDFPSSYNYNGRSVNGTASGSSDGEKFERKSTYGGSSSQKTYSLPAQNSADVEENIQKVSPPRRKISSRDERTEKLGNWLKEGDDPSTTTHKSQSTSTANANNVQPRHYGPKSIANDGNIDAILEEEEALIAAHRKEIEDTMEIVREEMKLLAEVEQPGSLIDNYVTQLSFVLSRKAAGLVSLQARLARFQHRLKEQEILSRKRVPH